MTKLTKIPKNTQTDEITDEDGNKVNVTIRKGNKMKIITTKLNGDATVKKEWLDDGVISEEKTDQPSVKKTVDDETYWQEEAVEMSVGDTKAKVQGDLVIVNITTTGVIKTMNVIKTNWKTGWRVYEYFKIYNETQTDYEFEYSGEITSVGSTPGFEPPSILLGLLVCLVVISRKRK
ncbi:MAG: hypothetical protein ACFFDC_08790 [Promethearchaeota archaeon]